MEVIMVKNLKLCELEQFINSVELIYLDKLNIEKNITYGLEIEFDGITYKKLKDIYIIMDSKTWKLKVEGTIPTGAEIVSPILQNNKQDWLELKNVCEFIRQINGYINKLCSGHIHIGAHILGKDLEHWTNFLKLWAVYEEVIYSFTLNEENYLRTGIYTNARPIGKDIYRFLNNEFEDASELILKIPFKQKLYGLNFNNVSNLDNEQESNTFEIRCPNGSLNELVWQNNINLFIKMIMYVKSEKFDKDLIDYKFNLQKQKQILLKDYYNINIQESLEFVDLIFDNNLDKIIFLRQYINKDLKKKVKLK